MSGRIGWDGPSGGWERPGAGVTPEQPPAAPSAAESDALPAYAAMAAVVGAIGLLLAGLITALTIEVGRSQQDEAWKVRVKLAALTGVFGFSSGAGITVGVTLLVALGLVRSVTTSRRVPAIVVGVGACIASVWLGIATAADIYATLSLERGLELVGGKTGAVVGDLATLVVLAAAGAWGAAATAAASR